MQLYEHALQEAQEADNIWQNFVQTAIATSLASVISNWFYYSLGALAYPDSKVNNDAPDYRRNLVVRGLALGCMILINPLLLAYFSYLHIPSGHRCDSSFPITR